MRQIILFLSVTLLFSCKTQQAIVINPEIDEIRDLDTLVVTAAKEVDYEEIPNEIPLYNPSAKRAFDLLHTRLELSFNWEKEQVNGLAELSVTPLSKARKILTLDAKQFDILHVQNERGEDLNYEYENDLLYINLGQFYTSLDTTKVLINYTANPAQGIRGGSTAITSDQGLFFINPTGEIPNKPQQIWTQGETEWNSRWFPTFDKPNERCTQEVILTVDDKFKTLSNGLLISSKANNDGTRTDHWKMEMPHAPYLFALAIGEYAVVKESWGDIPVEYYVEPAFEEHAKKIFPHTVEMLEFFSTTLGVDYPWSKYSQVVVRDYVSGAMENTTAVIFGEFMQDEPRALEDNIYSEQIVAHEMFHHWFGDYVTCESWSNLTMNEGFANYGEYLWVEHKHGRLEADYLRLNELQGYLQSIQYQGHHPLIDFGFDDKEDMFDAHSYNKGGLVLHMLRRYLGDELFFKGLRKYLNDNALNAVEAHHLRLAFEAVSGEDLNWFWNQWYFSSGHPRLEVSKSLLSKSVLIAVQQTQEGPKVPHIFQLPVQVDIYAADGSKIRKEIWIDQRVQSFKLRVDFDPVAIVFDADDTLLAEIEYEPKQEELAFIFNHAEAFIHQYMTFGALLQLSSPDLGKYAARAMNHESWVMRYLGLTALESVKDWKPYRSEIQNLAASDPHMLVQSQALTFIGENKISSMLDIVKAAIKESNPFEVTKSAIKSLGQLDKNKVPNACDQIKAVTEAGILYWCSQSYAQTEDPKYWSYFDSHLDKANGEAAYDFFLAYVALAQNANMAKSLDRLNKIAQSNYEATIRRAAAYKIYVANVSVAAAATLRSAIKQNTVEELYFLITKGE